MRILPTKKTTERQNVIHFHTVKESKFRTICPVLLISTKIEENLPVKGSDVIQCVNTGR